MDEQDVVRSLAALAQPVRLRVFRALVVAGPQGLTPGDLAAQLEVAATTLSFRARMSLSRMFAASPRPVTNPRAVTINPIKKIIAAAGAAKEFMTSPCRLAGYAGFVRYLCASRQRRSTTKTDPGNVLA